MPQTFVDFMVFAQKHYSEGKNLLIHCNLGESRSPSLALLFMAKSLHAISDRSYEEARREFLGSYPRYTPGMGIYRYFAVNWNGLGKQTIEISVTTVSHGQKINCRTLQHEVEIQCAET